MGFFEGLKRMANGEPVFQEGDANKGWNDKDGKERDVPQDPDQQSAQPQAQQPQGRVDGVVKGQASTFPVVVVKRTRTQNSGSNQTVYCSIVNRSNVAVEVEEIHLAGSSRRLGGYLRPGEEREWLCYSGPRSKYENNKEASLDYKVDETKDYFQSIYDVEYQFEQADGTYSVEELHYRAPIRDIYG
jgi:hypothetical protein